MEKAKKDILIILLFVLMLGLPFINKAYHIDDAAFLYIADQIEKDPLRPYSFTLEWGNINKPAHYLLDTPLVSYYMAVISVLFGKSEIVLHLFFLVFPLIAAISFYFIAVRFSRYPLLTTLILVSTPVFLVNSHNLMLDIPSLAFLLLSLALFIRGIDRNSALLLSFAGIAAGIAFLAKPQSLVVIPLLLAYCIAKKKYSQMAYALIPLLFVALFSLHNYFFEGVVIIEGYLPFLTGAKQSSIALLAAYTLSNLTAVGGGVIFPLLFCAPFLLRKKNITLLAASSILGLACAWIVYAFSSSLSATGQYSLIQAAMIFLFILGAAFFLLTVFFAHWATLRNFIRGFFGKSGEGKVSSLDTDTVFLLMWLFGTFAVNCVISGGAVRHIAYFAPAMVLVYVRMADQELSSPDIAPKRFLMVVLSLTLLLGISVAVADYQYAGVYRKVPLSLAPQFAPGDGTLHFQGGGGFQYYMAQQGYHMLDDLDDSPKKGDVMIRANTLFPRSTSPALRERMEKMNTIAIESQFPLRVHNGKAHAGFYTFGAGLLPYSFSLAPLETFDIYRVVE